MTFREAARILGKQITTADMAEALDVSPHSVRQARLEVGASGYRAPPPNWRPVLARLARGRARELEQLAAELEQASEV